ncbi:MAG TPA: 30S ribosomal protein S2, partial [Candidatus Marinimicrobia bacterium]|nr:30S ribosomal protein S2 [Candidatus Neomarinimicrobiota bacterium]
MEVTFDNLLSTGAHFGHLTRRWHPNYEPYILMERNGIHIINLEETLKGLTKAIDFLTDTVADGGEVLFVGTKKNAKDIIQQEADKCGMFYVVERWLGGTLTNFSTIRKSIKRLQLLEKESSPLYESATKKEILSLEREMIRLQDLHRGIKDMKRLPNAIFIVDARHESIAINEAHRLEIPVAAIVDTNTDPEVIDYPIPANDDSIRAIKLIVGEVSRAICDARSIAYPDGGAIPVAADGEETAEAESISSENGELAEGAEPKEAESEEIVVEKEESLSEDGEAQNSEIEEIATVEEVQEPEEVK